MADFNSDGIQDLVVSSDSSSTGYLSFFIGGGVAGIWNGTFSTGVRLGVPGNPAGAVVGDFNLDGILDVAVCISDSGGSSAIGGAQILLGNGINAVWDGTFTMGSRTGGNGSQRILAADFDQDGIPDIEFSNGNGWSILIGDGTGQFQGGYFYVSSATDRFGIAVADFNGDGFTDLAIAGRSSIRLMKGASGNPPGFVTLMGQIPVRGKANELVAADLDRDGILDLVVTRDTSRIVQCFHGSGSGGIGNGSFTRWDSLSLAGASGLAIGDFVSGAGPEVAVSEAQRDSVIVLGGSCGASLPLSITVLSPNGGEVWPQGTTHSITWSKGAGVAAVNLDFSHDNGMSWQRIGSSLQGTALTWKVTPPGTALARVRVSDFQSALQADLSDAPAIIQRTGTGVPAGGDAPQIARFSPPMPSPSMGAVRFQMDLPLAAAVRVDVYDVAGRLVRRLIDEFRPAGRYDLRWDGRSGTGSASGPGVYFVRARWRGFEAEHKMVRLR